MSEFTLPEQLNVFDFAKQNMQLAGEFPLGACSRLAAQTGNNQKVTASINLKFSYEGELPVLRGEVRAPLTLQCQRCLSPFVCEIISNFALGVVRAEQEAENSPGAVETIVVPDGLLLSSELIEDELLLNLPIVPKHEIDQCQVKLPVVELGGHQTRKNPFAVLASLKED